MREAAEGPLPGAGRADAGDLRRYRSAAGKGPGAEERRLEISRIEMRMAVLSARMAAPKKGDRPEMLQEEYMRLAEKLRELSG